MHSMSCRPVEESWPGKTFFSSEAAGDPDQPSPGMSPVGEAIAAIARGEVRNLDSFCAQRPGNLGGWGGL